MESPAPDRLAVAVASGVAVVAGTFLLTGFTPRWVVVALAQTVILLLPDALIASGIQGLGSTAQPLLVAGSGLLAVALFAAIALLATRFGRGADRERAETVFLVAAVQTLAAFLLTITPGAAVLGGALGGATVGLAGARATDPVSGPDRRGLLRSAGVATVAVAAAGAGPLARAVRAATTPADTRGDADPDPLVERLLAVAEERSFELAGAEPLVSESFYVVDKNPADPRVDADEWTLSVTGAVDEAVEVNLDDLRSRTAQHRFETLRCVGDPVNGRKMDTALWTGVPVSSLLAEAGVDDEGCCVMLRAADDYYEEFPLSALEDGLLAWGMNGRPLPRGHGAPVRALIPGHWGEINVKWLTEIEVLTEEATGYWEQKGWHGTGPASTVAKIHHVETREDGAVTVGGHAYAGTRGVSAVEVSTDGGNTWATAEVTERLPGATPADADPESTEAVGGAAVDAWRGWRHEYVADGEHEVVVRAVERDGTVQPSAETDPFPSGASGWVRRSVDP
ncbi:molybdopterin-dependent oxidoreductase [Halobaculum marinum]|uniref:Molybdopterin-dependent oxidoreductase n=1 Tax=Halobaculum marinum TaxID=3031996 RepID=A0ABD5WXX8_9EURY|nr:molybdopterin-dependent oxidoreductase [Halobaculum sp. DT55]